MIKILKYPNKILSTPSAKVALPLSLEHQNLIRQMHEAVDGIGVGLAAPQVGVNIQLCLIRLDPEIADRKDKVLDFVMINPQITFYSQSQVDMVEGCLSFPDEFYLIQRPANIIVEFDMIKNYQRFLDNGEEAEIVRKKLKASKWMSRVIQHEVDHLDGKVFIKKPGAQKIDPDDIDGRVVVD